ncbi:restriction endonuclease subunit S, partial [Burkholderia pseudomallei]
MSLPRYSKYKDSGAAAVGAVPHHWEIKPIKAVASINDDVLPETTDPTFELAYVDIGSVSLDMGIEKTEAFTFKDAPSRARRLVRHGDVIVSTVRTYLKAIAAIAMPPENLVVSTGFAVVRPLDSVEPRFAKYALQGATFIDEVISRSTGVSYPAINASDLARIALPVPPRGEQSAIAAFLDRETGKIDMLIAEQEKLLGLLAEKRQATISHAVTRGLNPDAPMKDSGVAWLGEVPANWAVKQL